MSWCVVGHTKDLERGERMDGWCVINVGAMQRGSRRWVESLSRRRGRVRVGVGPGGRGRFVEWKRVMRPSVADGVVRSGSWVSRRRSMVGMNSRRGKGAVNGVGGGVMEGRELFWSNWMCWRSPLSSSSVMRIRSSRDAKAS
jgi:hypothetical protein